MNTYRLAFGNLDFDDGSLIINLEFSIIIAFRVVKGTQCRTYRREKLHLYSWRLVFPKLKKAGMFCRNGIIHRINVKRFYTFNLHRLRGKKCFFMYFLLRYSRVALCHQQCACQKKHCNHSS